MRTNSSPPNNDLVAECSFLHVRIRKNLKWMLIHLVAIGILMSECVVSFDTYSFIVVLICFLNVCYYIASSFGFFVQILKLELNTKTHDCNAVITAPGLVRYFENRSLTFLCCYWDYFNHLVQSLRHIRLRRFGQNVEQFRIESELRNLEQNLKRSWKGKEDEDHFKHSCYRLDKWWKYDQKSLVRLEELDKYWKDYLEESKNELVKYSTVHDSSDQQCRQQLSFEVDYFKKSLQVPVSDIFSRLTYQLSYDPDATDISPHSSGPSYDLFKAMRSHHKERCFNPSSWLTNLRCWLSNKIKEVVQQFDAANEQLKSCGVSDVRIGSSDVSCLRSVFNQLMKSHLPLLDFLTLTHDQGYLVWRYRVLGSDGCMRHFCWNSGGAYRGTWNPAMGPNDSEVIMHFFSSYLDMKLPCYPSHPTRKRPFSDSYVFIGSNRTTSQYTNLAIIQRWVSPPHFNIIVEGRQLEMPRGNNNVFLAIGYLLYCIKTYHKGKIGRVSLGKHGLNLLWIVGDSSHP